MAGRVLTCCRRIPLQHIRSSSTTSTSCTTTSRSKAAAALLRSSTSSVSFSRPIGSCLFHSLRQSASIKFNTSFVQKMQQITQHEAQLMDVHTMTPSPTSRQSSSSPVSSSFFASSGLTRKPCASVHSGAEYISMDAHNDQVLLSGLTFFARHGVHAAERELGQQFQLDVVLGGVDMTEASVSDDLTKTIDYSQVYNLVKQVVAHEPPCLLLEKLALDVMKRIFLEFEDRFSWIEVTIRKPQVAVDGVVDSLGVRLRRSRDQIQ